MKAKISIADGRLLIEGQGVSFLKLKDVLVRTLSTAAVERRAPNVLSIPVDRIGVAARLLMTSGAEVSPAAKGVLEKVDNCVSRHACAKRHVQRILEENQVLTGDPAWDAVLDPKQAVAVNAMTSAGLAGLCLFDEQGTGKTVMTIAAFDILSQRREIDAMFVVCPKSMMSVWAEELVSFTQDRHTVTKLEGALDVRYERLQSDADVFVMNFECVEPLLTSLEGMCKNKRVLLVVDESFYVKNPSAIRSSAVRALRRYAVRCFVLCGTPAPNHSTDIINQFDIADNGITFEGFRVPEDNGAAKGAIMDRIADLGVYLRRLKDEMLTSLPKKNFTILTAIMSGRQAALYEQARCDLVLFLRGRDNTTFRRNLGTYFQKRAALLQICVSPRLVDPLFDDVPAKYAILDELLGELMEKGRKAVIWSFYRGVIDDLEERYEDHGLVRVDGSVATADARQEAVAAFQSDPGVRLFLGNPAAAGAGLTLHAAADAIYVSYSNQAAHYLQSLDRIHRRGQKASVTNYYLLVCKGTVEEKEIRRLRRKEKEQEELLGDRVEWPSSLDEAIRELEAGG